MRGQLSVVLHLEQVKLVTELPDSWTKEDAAQKSGAVAKQIEGALGGIVDSIENKVTDKIPRIISITFDTPIVSLRAKRAGVTVEVQVKQKPTLFKVPVDLSDLPSSIPKITAEFAKALA